ncbi:hypothetical protein N39L_54100 [Limnospira platensis NIES-39]|nr:hypothetical protein N39L_54100 [Arthrospira platensis NIES-39]
MGVLQQHGQLLMALQQAQPVKVMIVDYLTLGLPQRTHIQILH